MAERPRKAKRPNAPAPSSRGAKNAAVRPRYGLEEGMRMSHVKPGGTAK